MVSVSDLVGCLWCRRSLWLRKRLGIPVPMSLAKARGVDFHVMVHGMYEQVKRALGADIPGRIVATELSLPKKASIRETLGLVGRVDVLREVSDGYIVQDEKYSPPPESERTYPSHKLQLDAYSFLVEKDGYTPVKSAIIIYNDLRPREVAPDPERIPSLIANIEDVLGSATLPAAGGKCGYCGYSPLCAILPKQGGLSADEILALKHGARAAAALQTVARFESKTTPGRFYAVVSSREGLLSCDCPGWVNHGRCWHVQKALGSAK